MSLITVAIPKQGFEQVRDQIGLILKTEIDNQAVLSYEPWMDNIRVYLEKRNPVDKTEMPYIIVAFDGGQYGIKEHNGNVQATYNYNIDFFAQSKSKAEGDGDQISQTYMHRLLGICRYILDNPVYRTLAFMPGALVWGTTLTDAEVDNNYKEDAIQTAMGRLKMTVKVTETTSLIVAPLIAGFTTKFFINETEDGFLYIDNE